MHRVANPGLPPKPRAARRRARRIDFLFDPDDASRIIAELPSLSALLGDPHLEGEPALNLPGARKSGRELYRVLGNTHYPHLARLLETLDACAGAGFTQPELLRTRGRRPFVEGLAELHAAEHFRQQGRAISGFDDTKGNDPVPDILVEGNGVTAVVEVYCPQAWPGLQAYTDAIRDRVKNLDRGFDFAFRVEHDQLERFGPDMRLLHLHPGVLSDGLDEQARLQAIGALITELEAALDAGVPPKAHFEFPAINLVTTIELTGVTPASAPVPARGGVVGGPGNGTHRPEMMFTDIVGRVIDKLEERQAVGVMPGAVPVPVVELSQSDLTSELRHQTFYRPEFEKTIDAQLTDFHGYGVVAFCEVAAWREPLVLHFLRVDPSVIDDATALRLFP